jgi:TIR domain
MSVDMRKMIFISHSSKDQKVARNICAALEARGLYCWAAYRDVPAGANFQDAIVQAIKAAKVMLLLFTGNANNSDEIKKELALASQNKLVLIPVRIDDVTPSEALEYALAGGEWINLSRNWDKEIANLCTRLERLVPRETLASPDATAVSFRDGWFVRAIGIVAVIYAIVMILGVTGWPVNGARLTPQHEIFGAEDPQEFYSAYVVTPVSWCMLLLGIAMFFRMPRLEFAAVPICAVGFYGQLYVVEMVFRAAQESGLVQSIYQIYQTVSKNAVFGALTMAYLFAVTFGLVLYPVILISLWPRFRLLFWGGARG